MRPYEHWNEDEAYMQCMETRPRLTPIFGPQRPGSGRGFSLPPAASDPQTSQKRRAKGAHTPSVACSVGLEYLAFRLADGRPQPPASQSGRSNAHPGRANKERQPRAACLRPSSAPPATASRHVRAAPPRSAAMPPPLPRRARRRAHRHSPAILGKVGQGVAPALSLRDYPHQRNFDFSFSVFLYFCV